MSIKENNESPKERVYVALAVEGRDPRGFDVPVTLYVGEPKEDASPIAQQVKYYANKGISMTSDKIKLIETTFAISKREFGGVNEEVFNYAFNGTTKSISDTQTHSGIANKGVNKGIAG